jgi:spore coat protein CotH
MREALSYDVFTRAGVPAPKTAYVRVFVTVPGQYDHEYAGLFTAIEEIDQTFFKDRWGKKVGLLVKPEGLRGMPYLEGDWASYERPYGAKAGSTAAGQSRFIAFVKFLNEAPDKEFEQHIGEYLDVDEFLRFLAGEVVLVNTDSPLAMNHNYFVTIHPTTNKVTWVPWDMNMSFGGFMTGDENLSIHQPSGRGMFPLADRMLANKTLRARYDAILREMVTRNVTVSRLVGEMERIAPTIRPAVAKDESVSLGSFERNLLADLTLSPESNGSMIFGRGRNGPPLRVFLTARVESVLAQLDGKSEGTPGRGGRGGFGPPPSRGRGFTVR